jgi:hypothetical protein
MGIWLPNLSDVQAIENEKVRRKRRGGCNWDEVGDGDFGG